MGMETSLASEPIDLERWKIGWLFYQYWYVANFHNLFLGRINASSGYFFRQTYESHWRTGISFPCCSAEQLVISCLHPSPSPLFLPCLSDTPLGVRGGIKYRLSPPPSREENSRPRAECQDCFATGPHFAVQSIFTEEIYRKNFVCSFHLGK